MKKAFTLISLLFFLASACCAQDFSGLSEEFALALDLPDISENMTVDMYVVYGSRLDLVERTVLDSLTAEGSGVQAKANVMVNGTLVPQDIKLSKHFVGENETTLEDLSAGSSIVVLVGGKESNNLTRDAYDSGLVTNESVKYFGMLLVGRGELDRDSKLIVLAHKKTEKLEREAVNYSPLQGIVEDEYIPVTAASIGMILMSMLNVFKTVAEFLALNVGRKQKKFGHTGPHIGPVYLNEVAAILGAALVLGFAVTWTFAGPTSRFLELLPLNATICLFAALSHELSHRLVGRIFGVQVEYRFWPAGSAITIVTAFLGNSFGIQGFLMENVEGNISKWKYGVTKLAAPIVSATITASFAYLYLQDPQVIFQMIYTTASIWAMAEIIPVRGLDGHDIRRWNRLIWFIFFAAISTIYFTVNFIQ